MMKTKKTLLNFFFSIFCLFLMPPPDCTAMQDQEPAGIWEMSFEELQTIKLTTASQTEQSPEGAPSIVSVVRLPGKLKTWAPKPLRIS